MDLNKAIEVHMDWKGRFGSAIAERETLDVSVIARDDCCDLGRWLHSAAKDKYATFKSYSTCLDNHAVFHVEAGKVAQTINAKKYADAEAMLNAGTSYSAASTAVCIAIMRLKNEISNG